MGPCGPLLMLNASVGGQASQEPIRMAILWPKSVKRSRGRSHGPTWDPPDTKCILLVGR
jgi:hypothetical protein